jgi:hypothetical protein
LQRTEGTLRTKLGQLKARVSSQISESLSTMTVSVDGFDTMGSPRTESTLPTEPDDHCRSAVEYNQKYPKDSNGQSRKHDSNYSREHEAPHESQRDKFEEQEYDREIPLLSQETWSEYSNDIVTLDSMSDYDRGTVGSELERGATPGPKSRRAISIGSSIYSTLDGNNNHLSCEFCKSLDRDSHQDVLTSKDGNVGSNFSPEARAKSTDQYPYLYGSDAFGNLSFASVEMGSRWHESLQYLAHHHDSSSIQGKPMSVASVDSGTVNPVTEPGAR